VLIELGMDRDRVSHLTLSEWKNAFAHLFRQMKSDLQDAITCLRRVPLTDTVAVIKGHREYYVGNYRSLLTYFTILEEYRVKVQLLTGVECQLAKLSSSDRTQAKVSCCYDRCKKAEKG